MINTAHLPSYSLQPLVITIHKNIKLNYSALKNQVYEHGLVLLKNHNIASKNDFIDFAQGIGETLAWDFGVVNELIVDENAKNYLYSNEEVPFHWDGAFYHEPGILLFHCVKAADLRSGGETLFTDTSAIYRDQSQAILKEWENIIIKYCTEKIVHYGGQVERELIARHPVTNEFILRYAEAVTSNKNPVSCEIMGLKLDQQENFINMMRALIYNSKYCYTHIWSDNDILLVDNHRMIHARNKMVYNSPRRIRRIQIL